MLFQKMGDLFLMKQLGVLCLLMVVNPTSVFGAEADPMLAAEKHQQALFEKIAPSVVFLSSGTGFGSGFVVATDGLILTNAHVIGNSKEIQVVFLDGTKKTGTVVQKASDKIDLALVKVAASNLNKLDLSAANDLKIGSWVGSIGHNQGGIWTYNIGMISNIYPDGTERPIFQTQIPLNPGSSGGPIFDRKGTVVGIVTAGISGLNSINFGIRIDVAIRQFSELKSHQAQLLILVPPKVVVFADGVMVGTGPKVLMDAKDKTYEISAVVRGKLKKQQVRFPETRKIDWR